VATDYALRERVQRLLAEGQLPRAEPPRGWVARGTGQPCGVCGQEIDPTEYEVELEFTAEVTGSVLTYIFHGPCHTLWDTERLQSM